MPDTVPGKRLGRKVPEIDDPHRPIERIDYTDDRARYRFGCNVRLSRDLMVKRGLLSPEDAPEKEGGPGEEPDRATAAS